MADVDPGWSGGDPGAVIGWTLVRAHHQVARLFTETLAAAGLTPAQFGVLVQLASEPALSQAEIARRVLVTPQSIGELLTSVQRLGLVDRTPARPGRATTVTLTVAGRAALDRATPLVRDLNTPQALGLTPQEGATLNTLLHKVLRATTDP
ncbi:MarR family winged helix-turn-helix transcriptional regulator [Micromonospora sp. 067-2]|uniref:MarR family winged helix-turn-helix transcriptional regulator n=1 Tax=Micromonospora sp. 067-2 TaxID=2789270 RepID=UPI0039789EF8